MFSFLRRAGAVSICLSCIAACAHVTNETRPAPTSAPKHVGTIMSKRGHITPQRSLSGFIAPFQNVTLSTTLAEPAAHVDAQEGDHVKAGQVLAVFDVSDLKANLQALERSVAEADANTVRQQFQSSQTIGQSVESADQAQASLTQARVKLQEDERDFARDEALLDKGFIAKQAVDQQQTAVAGDRASVASGEAVLRSARITVNTNGTSNQGLQGASIAAERAAAAAARAQADQLRAQISRATMTAPVDGVVINRNVNPGEYPNSRTLFTIAQSGIVYAILNASPAQIPGIRRGQVVTITLSGTSQMKKTAHVVAVLGQTTPGSTNFTVKTQIDDADDTLLSGLPLTATVLLDDVAGTEIPRTAFTDGTQSHVIVIRDHVAHVMPVDVLAQNGDEAIIRGIDPYTTLVSNADTGIADGEQVATAR